MHNTIKILSIILLISLASCANQGDIKTRVTSLNAPNKIDVSYNLNSAKKYLKLANATNDTVLKQYNSLQACHYFIKANELDTTRQIIDSLGEIPINTDNYHFKNIVTANILNKSANSRGAQTILDSIWVPQELPSYLQKLFFETQAQVKAKNGALLEALKLRLALSTYDLTSAESQENNHQLWKLLYSFTPSDLTKILDSPELPADLKGWIAMARLNKQYETDPDQINRALAMWQQEFPNHPAYEEIYGQSYDDNISVEIPQQPNHIALLLPLSNPGYGAGAKAIRDGFLAKHYQQKERNNYSPKISFYDTTKIGVEKSFEQAKIEGAQIIVGPLLKEEITQLITKKRLDIPVLALNTLSNRHTPNNLYQFGLNPEFEAETIANKALNDGHKYAVAIVPDNDWGSRMLSTFEQKWNNSGAIVLETIKFSSTNDLNTKIPSLLGLNSSKKRIGILNQIGVNVSSAPRRRQDIDFIFIAANPVMARQIKPLLNFHYAGKIPIYASSSIYEGFNQPSKDQDLNGIHFCDMPWIIDDSIKLRSLYTQINNLWPVHMKKNPRLVALGIDAYKISTSLNQLASRYNTGISGMTGMLYLENDRQISRELMWADIKDGKVK
ncbi:MAG: penicillin-binding protein activator [Francisellaceae bacterium]|jgi:uncharacterized protein|nr:penicillin-binding protein activator [Francisellaceae bacterium]